MRVSCDFFDDPYPSTPPIFARTERSQRDGINALSPRLPALRMKRQNRRLAAQVSTYQRGAGCGIIGHLNAAGLAVAPHSVGKYRVVQQGEQQRDGDTVIGQAPPRLREPPGKLLPPSRAFILQR